MKNYIVECATCGRKIENWVGSTPCCGSISYLVDECGNTTKKVPLFMKDEDLESIKMAFIDFLKIKNEK